MDREKCQRFLLSISVLKSSFLSDISLHSKRLELAMRVAVLVLFKLFDLTCSSLKDNVSSLDSKLIFFILDSFLKRISSPGFKILNTEEEIYAKLQQNSDIWQIYCIRQPKI
ncbi:hypothetical protein BpHYR1_017813 [Brachionus plicatilis]|uniref:Uncharacterized protein n=1 Tax=Brachionus plicatilis TaxID=10195 RepID=A0A3M7RM81_BRAPC|nr:hypothetical protein BpHYR1_017813 [Brachionus plicatilis]